MEISSNTLKQILQDINTNTIINFTVDGNIIEVQEIDYKANWDENGDNKKNKIAINLITSK